MNTINEFDLYRKTQVNGDFISNIKVDSFKGKFTLSIKENKDSNWINVVNRKDNDFLFDKPHLLILLKSVDVPFELLKKIENGESIELRLRVCALPSTASLFRRGGGRHGTGGLLLRSRAFEALD